MINKELQSLYSKIRMLEKLCYQQTIPIDGWQIVEKDNPTGILTKVEEDISIGSAGITKSQTMVLQSDAIIPDEIKGTSFDIEIGLMAGEGLLFIDGESYCGLDHYHQLVLLQDRFREKSQLELKLRVRWKPHPSHPGVMGKPSGIAYASWIQLNPIAKKMTYELRQLIEMGQQTEDQDLRDSLYRIVRDILVSIRRNRNINPDVLSDTYNELKERINSLSQYKKQGTIHIVGHSHIDAAWLWNYEETREKVGCTFSTALRLMERFPHFHFSINQAQIYQFAEENFPELIPQIKDKIKQKRWEVMGGLWIETDCHIPSGESIIRQALYGLEYFDKHFGKSTPVAWLLDVFGFAGNLPQIFTGSGIDWFYTTKLYWQSRNIFPYRSFWWEGIDGTRILTHCPYYEQPNIYNIFPDVKAIKLIWDHHTEKEQLPEILIPTGWGDGGGGPTYEMIDAVEIVDRMPGLPKIKWSSIKEFFELLETKGDKLPVWSGELYYESHQGVFTTQGWLKRGIRKAENLLRNIEIILSLCQSAGSKCDITSLREVWNLLLLIDFHDVAGGTVIPKVIDKTREYFEVINKIGLELLNKSTNELINIFGGEDGKNLLLINTLCWKRDELIEIPIKLIPDKKQGIKGPSGELLDTQKGWDYEDSEVLIVRVKDVPPMGYQTLELTEETNPSKINELNISKNGLENQFFIIDIDNNGEISNIYDKREKRDVIEKGKTGGLCFYYDGVEVGTAWNFDIFMEKIEKGYCRLISSEVRESGPLRGIIRQTFKLGDKSTFIMDIITYRDTPKIDFRCKVEMYERLVTIKVEFPLNVHSQSATFETHFGAIKRPTHRNTSWEWEMIEFPAQRWGDISDPGYGVGLLNDCKYGYSVEKNRLSLTLLRTPVDPDPKADEGTHYFTFSLYPHKGEWHNSDIVHQASALNVPMIIIPDIKMKKEKTYSFISIKPDNIILETIKPAESEPALVLRFYECSGTTTKAEITINALIKNIQPCNLIEKPLGKSINPEDFKSIDFAPFQIKTFLIFL